MKLEYVIGATPLDPDEIVGLIPDHINTQAELNEWEQANILEAEMWFSRFSIQEVPFKNSNKAGNYQSDNTLNTDKLLTTNFIQQAHKKMFDQTWRWAGKFRKTDKNIGVDWLTVPIKLNELLEDVRYQINHSSYNMDEIAVRLHHRLVSIHPFPNGNGRHARYVTDILLRICNQPVFSWGQQSLYENSHFRMVYINALKAADKHDYTQLLSFVRQ